MAPCLPSVNLVSDQETHCKGFGFMQHHKLPLQSMFVPAAQIIQYLVYMMITHQAWCSQEVHASVAVLLEPEQYMTRHFRAMCSEKRQDFLTARNDYSAMALQSKKMHEKVAAHKVGSLHVYTTCLCMLRNAERMKQICTRTGTVQAKRVLISAPDGNKTLS